MKNPTTASQAAEIAAFLASLLYYLTPDDAGTTEADARATLAEWKAEGIETPEGLTPATLAEFYRTHAPRDGAPDPDGPTPAAPVDQTGPGSAGTDGSRTDDGRPDAATLGALRAIITEAETMRGAYFFTPPASAGGRRTYERQHTHPRVTWTEGGRTYTAEYSTRATCRAVYAVGTYTRDGQRTTLTAIRNSLRRMEAGS